MAPKVMGEKDGELVQLFGWDTEAAAAVIIECITFKIRFRLKSVHGVNY